MSKRASRNNSDAVGLFPFLAVLLCTMGALLVLLVVLAQRAAQQSAFEVIAQTEIEPEPEVSEPHKTSAPNNAPADKEEVAALENTLNEVQKSQEQMKLAREDAEKRLRDEQAKLSHLEEHTRRLEHKLAKLSLAAEHLKATENNQSVDQEQAESELAHLQSLIEENQEQLEELREQAKGKHSYAIVPYKGPNGTFRKPVYIECRKDGVFIQPEGHRLMPSDFADTSWPGNPLAAALRATREYQNSKAAQAGESEPPDPYPLLLVRPDGIEAYTVARAAIKSWDSDYGYEFIAGDWKLDYPEFPDPMLAQVQNHAILNARDKMAILARSAPSRFRGMGATEGSSRGYGGTGNSSGFGSGGDGSSSGEGDSFADSSSGGSPDGNGLAAGEAAAHYGNSSSSIAGGNGQQNNDTQYGALANGTPSGETDGYQSAYNNLGGSSSEAPASGYATSNQSGQSNHATGQNSPTGAAGGAQSGASGSATGSYVQGGQPGISGSVSSSGGSSSSNGSSASAAASGQTAAGAVGSARTNAANLNYSMQSDQNASSIADIQGNNWAIQQGGRGSVPIRRPIEVVVRQNQIAMLPSRHSTQGIEAEGAVVSLNQPINDISDQFVTALRTRVKEWGLAGNGLYWRPVLELKVGPDAQHTAHEITRLLKDSGVEVRLPEMARSGQGANSNASK